VAALRSESAPAARKTRERCCGEHNAHHFRQHSTVRRSTPTVSLRRRIRAVVMPSRRIAIRMTAAVRETLRPRKRDEGEVSRVRRPCRVEHKLSQSWSGPKQHRRQHGLRRNLQNAGSPGTSAPSLGGEILITGRERAMKGGICQQICIQRYVLPALWLTYAMRRCSRSRSGARVGTAVTR
jgi:hypothetical protein